MDQAKSDRERLAEIERRIADCAADEADCRWLADHASFAIKAADAPTEVAAAINAMWPIKNGTVADMARAGVAAATAWRKAHEPKPSEIDVEAAARRWHVAAQNDGLFIIDAPPRPSNDEQFHDRQDGPRMAIPVSPLCEHRVIEIVNAHNRALDAHRRARGEDVEALKVALAKAEAERVRLRFAILAGEDVPGFAETVSTVECTELLAEERRRQRDRAEKAEAERDALREQVETLRGALEPFSNVAECDIGIDESDSDLFRPMLSHNIAPRLQVGDLRRARAALAATDPEKQA